MSSQRFALLLVLLAACGPIGARPAGPDDRPKLGEVASVRLFDLAGPEVTEHLPLPAGQTIRVAVRLYAPDSREILETPGVELGFTFNPVTMASSAPVTGQPLSRDITSTSPNGTHGSLSVSIRAPDISLNRTFGPFDALIH